MKRLVLAALAALMLALAAVSAQAAPDPGDASGFVLVSDAVPDAILEIRYFSTYNFVGERIDGYDAPVAALTAEAAKALRAVSDALEPMGYRLKIYDAYRPAMAVAHFVRWAQDASDTRMKAYFYPDLNKSVLFDRGYIGRRSGHSRGSTVDLTLFDMAAGRELDMGGTFDYFGELSHPDYAGVTREQYENRMLLRRVMMDHGFRPLSTEWWHFTLVDEPYPDTYFTFPLSAVTASDAAALEAGQAVTPLARGDRGASVMALQRRLADLGWLEGDCDGVFGGVTQAAVRAFQQAAGLEETGVADAATLAALAAQDAPAVGEEPAAGQDAASGIKDAPRVDVREALPASGGESAQENDGEALPASGGESASDEGEVLWFIDE